MVFLLPRHLLNGSNRTELLLKLPFRIRLNRTVALNDLFVIYATLLIVYLNIKNSFRLILMTAFGLKLS